MTKLERDPYGFITVKKRQVLADGQLVAEILGRRWQSPQGPQARFSVRLASDGTVHQLNYVFVKDIVRDIEVILRSLGAVV